MNYGLTHDHKFSQQLIKSQQKYMTIMRVHQIVFITSVIISDFTTSHLSILAYVLSECLTAAEWKKDNKNLCFIQLCSILNDERKHCIHFIPSFSNLQWFLHGRGDMEMHLICFCFFYHIMLNMCLYIYLCLANTIWAIIYSDCYSNNSNV